MSEPVQIILGFLGLAALFVVTRYIIASQLRGATEYILRDLESQEAKDILSAVDLPYAKPNILRVGMRNYHTKALEYLIAEGVVTRTGAGKYYLSSTRERTADG